MASKWAKVGARFTYSLNHFISLLGWMELKGFSLIDAAPIRLNHPMTNENATHKTARFKGAVSHSKLVPWDVTCSHPAHD